MPTALAISGSPRLNGNTEQLLRRCLDRLATQGIPGELITLAGKTIHGCGACGGCRESKDSTCPGQSGDDFEAIFQAMLRADIIVVGSPVYFGSLTGQIKAYMDRVGFVSRVTDSFLARKIGAAVVPARRAGHLFTFAELNMWFLI
ncbi:MAG TPA: flavodoxin family protein, partial [Opitutaceae bacterium]|nr:flavodoxin family protein [Opitutaceae bacterium]